MKSIDQIALGGKKLFIRADFNVPLDEERHITDDNRIRMVLPTLEYALKQGASLVLASHGGRPKGKPDPKFSLKPVAERLGELLGRSVTLAPDCIGAETQAVVFTMKPGDVVLLENLRFHPGETDDDPEFARQLAMGCDVYINDAFGVSHRAHASVSAVTRFFKEKAAGLLMKRELDYFHRSMERPERPLVALIGGAKVTDKLELLEHLLRNVDKLIIGGAMANTFLRAQGFATGRSLVEEDMTSKAAELMEQARRAGKPFYVPVDAVVGKELDVNTTTQTVAVQEVPGDFMILDIGPASTLLFSEALKGARTIIWNGPMGAFEFEPFSKGTYAVMDAVADSGALTIIGGGDTGLAVHRAGKEADMSFISTGGGAFLTLLEGKTLPGVAALES
ncbi:MAG: phosphoglycerate kinase [Deltaproteobacteria bacterium]|nr:phosphoglycerate kinase [Deltaproteobacteria bacterium]